MVTPASPQQAAASNGSSTKSAATAKQAIGPIEVLDTGIAKTFDHAHTFVVLGILFTSFSRLVADPISAMLGTLAPVAALQGVHAAICLPAAAAPGTSTTGKRKGKEAASGIGGVVVRTPTSTGSQHETHTRELIPS